MVFDVDMPNKSGGDLAAEASSDPVLKSTPILFLTGLLSRSEAGNNEVECGGRPFLAKPVMPDVLLASVGRLVGAAVI
jgi:CheY-like chemotaxis protein